MSRDGLSIAPTADPDEAAAIAAAIRAHTGTDGGETRTGSDGAWADRGWALAARLEAVGLDPARARGPGSPWHTAIRRDG